MTTAPPTRRRLALSATNPSSGRIAATGGIREARRAGTITDINVTPIPTIAEAMTVRGNITIEIPGNPAPAALKMPMMPRATKSPPNTPITVATTATARASSTIMRRTCEPLAPTDRSSASSRSR